jgi:hypothetical protein
LFDKQLPTGRCFKESSSLLRLLQKAQYSEAVSLSSTSAAMLSEVNRAKTDLEQDFGEWLNVLQLLPQLPRTNKIDRLSARNGGHEAGWGKFLVACGQDLRIEELCSQD